MDNTATWCPVVSSRIKFEPNNQEYALKKIVSLELEIEETVDKWGIATPKGIDNKESYAKKVDVEESCIWESYTIKNIRETSLKKS